MMHVDLLVRDGRVVMPGQGIFQLDVAIDKGKIAGLLNPGLSIEADCVLDAKDKLVLPGGVDAHTHLTMGPGEIGYETETRSAAVGGITTTLSYLLDAEDPEQSVKKEIDAGEKRACGDFGLHPAIVTDEQVQALGQTVKHFGIPSFKFFMIFRGEEGVYLNIPGNDDGFLFKLFRTVASLPGVIPCVHAENIELIWVLRPEVQKNGDGGLGDWDRSRPDFAEAEAVQRALYLAEKTDCPLYVVHVTSRETLEVIKRAKARRPGKVFAETCPHYLTLTCENGPFPAGKVNPPLRHPDDVEALWGGIADGAIDVVGSDHVPRRMDSKSGGIWKASAGFPGVATLLPVFLTEGIRRGLPLAQLVEKISIAPAEIFGLAPAKGTLLPGGDGDLTIIDPEVESTVSSSMLASDSDYTPFEGMAVRYMPTHTVLRGNVVVEEGRYVGSAGVGSYVPRKAVSQEK
jgi:dihydropyrimidinase